MHQIQFGGRAPSRPAGGAKALPDPLAAIKRPTSKGRGREGRAREGKGGKGKERRGGKRGEKKGVGGGRGWRKGRDEGKGNGKGWEGSWCPPHDFFAPRPCQYSGPREASFELSNATICPHGSKLWCSDLAIDNALRGKIIGEK